MAEAKSNTTPLAEHCNSLWETLEDFSDALAVISIVAQDEESRHGAFCRSLRRLLSDVYDDIENIHNAMKGERA